MAEQALFGYPVVEGDFGDMTQALSEIKLGAGIFPTPDLNAVYEALRGPMEEAVRLAMEAAGALSWVFADVMAGVMAGIKQVNASMMELVLDDDERERCCRAYATQLNQCRQWRKTSWRRLNRDQRREAAHLWWIEQYQRRK